MREMIDTGNDCLTCIPAEWQYTRLKYYCKISNGSDPQTEGDIPAYGSGKEVVKYCGEYKEGPAILLGRKGTLDNPRYIEGKFWNVDTAMDAYPINGINPRFLFFITTILDIQRYATSTAKPSMTQSDYYNMPIPIPSREEQDAIVSFVDSKCSAIDEAIERHKKIIEKLEEYKRSSIIKAVNGDISDNTKASGIAWMPTVPSHWGVVPMRFALTQRKNKNEGLVEKNLLTLSYGKIKRKDIETNEGLLPASFEGYNIIEASDIVLRLMDLQNDKHSLRTGLVTERGIITSAYVTVIPTEGFDPAYCRYLLHAYDLMKVFYSMGEGVRQGLTYDDLSRTLLIPKPPIDEQSKIASNIIKMEGSVDASIGKQNAMLEKLEEYRKSVIYNAVTGKIDCRTETQP